MLSSGNLLKPATGRPIVNPTKDIILGCYWLSQIKEGALGEGKVFSSAKEALIAHETGEIDLRAKIKIKAPLKNIEKGFVETTVGRILFNEILPEDFPFCNEVLDSQKLEEISWELIQKYGTKESPQILDKIKELGFEYSTLSGISMGIDDFVVPLQKAEILKEAEKEIENIQSLYRKGLLTSEEKTERVIEIWTRAKTKIETLLPKTLPIENPISIITNSGCRFTWSQPVQMSGMRGLMVNPLGETIELPIKSSFKEGLNVLEYFISTHGARKGVADTALLTSKAGYLTRRLIDVAHEVMIREKRLW
jgi:DNA-directed RNA polymerase subunit beta'